MKNTKLIVLLLWTATNLVIAMNTVFAAQTIGVDVYGQIIPIVPDRLTLPTAFVDKFSDKVVYQALDPGNTNNQIRVIDNKNNGGFWLTLQVTNFTSGANVIPYTNLGIVTLADSPAPKTVDTLDTNEPPGDDGGRIFAPLDCDWDKVTDFGTFCKDTRGFTLFDGSGGTSNPITIINGQILSGPGRTGQEWVTLGTRLLIPANTPPGEYQSTFTFTIYTTP